MPSLTPGYDDLLCVPPSVRPFQRLPSLSDAYILVHMTLGLVPPYTTPVFHYHRNSRSHRV